VRTADLELAARCRAGDAGAFEELYRQHARRLFGLVVRMVGSVEDAEDLLQEVWMNRRTESLDEDGVEEPIAPAPVVPAAVSRLDLERAINMLPAGARAAFLLHDVEGFEHREIAHILGISEGTSKSQVHKARMKLRTMLRR
jgi:RNA polymerase sigma-70 factor, ECF subfamily